MQPQQLLAWRPGAFPQAHLALLQALFALLFQELSALYLQGLETYFVGFFGFWRVLELVLQQQPALAPPEPAAADQAQCGAWSVLCYQRCPRLSRGPIAQARP